MSRRDKPPLAAGGAEREQPSQVDRSEQKARGGRPHGDHYRPGEQDPEPRERPQHGRRRARAGAHRGGGVVEDDQLGGGELVAGHRPRARAARDGESPGELFELTGRELRAYARGLLEIVEPEPDEPEPARIDDVGNSNGNVESLRLQGAELLRRSADVTEEADTHPAYERIIEALAPDEGRILRLLATRGAQASVDVRTARPLDIGSELIAPGLSMIGAEAGVRYPDKVHSYLNNLYRLGLLWFSREALDEQGPTRCWRRSPRSRRRWPRPADQDRAPVDPPHPVWRGLLRDRAPLGTEELEALPRDAGPPPQPDVNDEEQAP